MDRAYIEFRAWELQAQIWREKSALWRDGAPPPIQMLEPEIAAKVLGVRFEYQEELGPLNYAGSHSEIAGRLNRNANEIVVSRNFTMEEIRFTGAHEIGHWLLHKGLLVHRDRPLKGSKHLREVRPSKEQEADHFAACFLMPRNLVKATFESTFSIQAPFVMSDDAAYWLCPHDPDSVWECNTLERAAFVSSAKSYGGKLIDPLTKQFRVSVSAMAIRLVELGLIAN
jgi:Zn-dependent peptidase ImmA (M78 family)